MKFEWDRNKAEINIKTHRISFEEASEVFFDEFALDIYDEAHSEYTEDRFLILGLTSKGVL